MSKVRMECEERDFRDNFGLAAAVAGIAFLCEQLPENYAGIDLRHLKDCAAMTYGSVRNAIFEICNIQPLSEEDHAAEPVNHIGH